MAEIIFNDGKTQTVGYNQAAKIHQVLSGIKEPDDEEQKMFCLRVAAIKFDELPKVINLKQPVTIKKDKQLHKIMADKRLKGYAKFVAIGNRLKERKVKP